MLFTNIPQTSSYMKNSNVRRFFLSLAAVFLFFLTNNAGAVPVTYNFEQFGASAPPTPLLTLAPDIGPAAFQASFTSTPNAAGFNIVNGPINQLFSGNCLLEFQGNGGNTLNVSLNMLVTSISVAFAYDTFGGGHNFLFNSSSGSTSMAASVQNGFDGGILTFTSVTPFSSFTLRDSLASEFAIDNLVMETSGQSVPEPSSTFLLLALAALPLLGLHRLRRNQLS
jgi:hypothetical protein